jgi:hypothetical protein
MNGHTQSRSAGLKGANKRHRTRTSPKQKAARRRLLNSNLMIDDQAAINAGFDLRR